MGMQPKRPEPTSYGSGLILVVVSIAVGAIALAVSDDGWIPLLDSANLAFHEAGHLIFGILGETPGLYGGTLGQLVFPIAVIVTFWRQENTLGLAVGWAWLFENFLNIARYMGDARAQALPLVGGGDHDWTNILGRWGALSSDASLAGDLAAIAWMGLFGLWSWGFLRWLQSR